MVGGGGGGRQSGWVKTLHGVERKGQGREGRGSGEDGGDGGGGRAPIWCWLFRAGAGKALSTALSRTCLAGFQATSVLSRAQAKKGVGGVVNERTARRFGSDEATEGEVGGGARRRGKRREGEERGKEKGGGGGAGRRWDYGGISQTWSQAVSRLVTGPCVVIHGRGH